MVSRNQLGRPMTSSIAWYLVMFFVLTAPGMAYCQQARQSRAEDRATLIILAPVGPVFVDLHLTVSLIPYREWVAQFLAKDMDVDKSGRLDADELNLLTESIKQLIGVQSSSEILKAMNASSVNAPSSDQVPVDVAVEDFVEWLRNHIPRAFDLIAQPQAVDDAVRLASLVDIDHDGAISEEELSVSSRTLRFRDLDNDETFSVSELLPYRDPRSQNAAVAPDAVSLPFFHVVDHESAGRAAERIVQRYGKDGRVPQELVRQSKLNQAEAISAEKTLTAGEVLAIVEKPQFHMVMEVSLSVQANTSNIKVAISRDASEFCKPEVKQEFGQYSLAIDGLPLKVQALGGAANDRRNTQGYLGQTFVMSDADRNQYLAEGEFSGMIEALNRSGVNGDFGAVDFNGDKMVTRHEVFSFAKRDQMAVASRVQVSVKQDGKTLFGILDTNSDRRLSVREMRSGAELLKPYDFNRDNKFADSELGTEFVLAISLGRPEFRRSSGQGDMMSGGMNSGDAILPGSDSLSGPEWFRRMDRNQDGDVSAREFLGTKGQFTRIDANSDELLSAEEATNVSVNSNPDR
jgi:Ca2+-binding EF-hand superfamily protein